MSTVYLEYTIYLTDKDQVATLQAAPSVAHLPRNTNPGSWSPGRMGSTDVGHAYGAPTYAATRYAAPVVTNKSALDAPCISSTWITDLAQTNYPIGQDDFERGHGGFFGFILDFFGGKKTYIWRGSFAYIPVPISTVPGSGGTVPVEAIQQRRFIEGFEQPEQGCGGTSGALALEFSRVASRHVAGMGLALRSSDGVKTHSQVEFGAAANNKTWERLYVRLIKAPSAATTFWRSRCVAGAHGVQLAINATGAITINDTTNAGVQTLIGTTSALPLRSWIRLDILLEYGAAAKFELWLQGNQSINVTSFGAGGLAQVSTHVSSEVGSTGQSANGLELDIDDWMAAERPTLKTGNDFINGSKIVALEASGFDSDMADWAGDWRAAAQKPAEDSSATLTSATSGARLSIKTRADQGIDAEPGSIGCVAFVVGKYGRRGSTENGTLGFKVAGLSATLVAITEDSTDRWNTVPYFPSGMTTPNPVSPVVLVHEKGASSATATVESLCASAELIGTFGPEDVKPSTAGASPATVKGGTGIHNQPYPRTAWARIGPKPISPVVVHTGTYTGNGSGQDLVFRVPFHFLWIRHVNSAHGGTFWFSSHIAAHPSVTEQFEPAGMSEALIDPDFAGAVGGEDDQSTQSLARLVGSAAAVNQLGETYQFVAFCDPGMRFMLNGALTTHRGTADKSTTLVNTNFLPDALFLSKELMNGGASVKTYYKGPGHATQSISNLGAAETASALAFNRGSLTSRSAIHFSGTGQAIPFSAWRKLDGSSDPGIPVQIGSYTGDGTGNRTIALTPASGFRPCFAIVVPHDAASVVRDPSHTGTTSTTLPASNNAANGIRGGGVDQLLVGSDLNVAATVYEYFVFPGDATSGNNGFGTNLERVPVAPAAPVDGPFDDDPTIDPSTLELTGTDDGGDVGGVPGGEDFGTQCVAASTKVINQALARIGITNPIADVVNEQSPEAEMARLHYQDEVEATLREFDWAFATGYLALTLVAGTADDAVNNDWQYSYGLPTDMVKARRLVREGIGREFDPNPPKFRIGAGVIYTDETDPNLEYTFRPACAAGAGDALFRDALAWRVATRLAPSIAKNKMTAKDCWQMYLNTLRTAATVNANEAQRTQNHGEAEWITGRE